MNKLRIVWAFLLIVLGTNAQNAQKHKKALGNLVEDFRVAIIEHDAVTEFYDLFLHDSITWSNIVVGKTQELILRQDPSFTSKSGTMKDFFQNLEKGMEEKFYNVDISIRDEFATISFDYSFHKADTLMHWGTEYWSLMLLRDSWKITSVTWSGNLQQLQKCPFANQPTYTYRP